MLRNPVIVCLTLAAIVVLATVAEAVVVLTLAPPPNRLVIAGAAESGVYRAVFGVGGKGCVREPREGLHDASPNAAKRVTWNLRGGMRRRR